MVHYFASMRCLASVLLVALILFTLYLQSWSKFSLQAFDCSDPVDLKTLSNQDCINHHEKKSKKTFAVAQMRTVDRFAAFECNLVYTLEATLCGMIYLEFSMSNVFLQGRLVISSLHRRIFMISRMSSPRRNA